MGEKIVYLDHAATSFPKPAPVLQAMEGPGIAVADMTTFHRGLLSRKRFWDMSGNNVNHPNDWLIRVQGQIIAQALWPNLQ